MVSGIEAVHAVDLVHRDLKLENIGVTHSGVVKLLDFGLAGDIRGKDGLDTQCGTMVYSAPELLGESVYGKQVDIWSMYVSPSIRIFLFIAFLNDSYFLCLNSIMFAQKHMPS